MGYKTKEDRHYSVLARNFFYMSIFTLWMPLMGLTRIDVFFDEIGKNKIKDLPAVVSENLLS